MSSVGQSPQLLIFIHTDFTDFTDFICMPPVLTIRVISVIRGFLTSSPFCPTDFTDFTDFICKAPVLPIRVIRVIRVTTSHPLNLLPPLSPWRGAGGEAVCW